MSPSGPRSPVDLGTPLHDVTFCVIDLETTGGSRTDDGITEIGAVKLRGGECLGTYQTMVNPGRAVPPTVTVLTGISDAMVLPAPRIEQVLPSLLEFVRGGVVVGHNVRFDLAFLGAALDRAGYPALTDVVVDTCVLARRLVRDEVPDCRLGTLAAHLGLAHRPCHRALADAQATGELLHRLLERAAGFGVTGLDDLLAVPRLAWPERTGKLRLTAGLPRAPGVYVFRDRAGTVRHVGRATDLRARVRSYFSVDRPRAAPALLREVQRIDHQVCASPLEAAVQEVRLQHRLRSRPGAADAGPFVRLTLSERFPRLAVVRRPREGADWHLGPIESNAAARRVVEAVESVIPLRRCRVRIGPRPPARETPCPAGRPDLATCPCAGGITERAYAEHVRRALRGLTTDPPVLLEPLRARMEAFAAARRYERAAEVRDRAEALSAALRRQRRIDALRRAGRVVVQLDGGGGAELVDGRLVSTWAGAAPRRAGPAPPSVDDGPPGGPEPPGGPGRLPAPDASPAAADRLPPCPRGLADEVLAIAGWLDQQGHRVRLLHSDRGLCSPLPALATFRPGPCGAAS